MVDLFRAVLIGSYTLPPTATNITDEVGEFGPYLKASMGSFTLILTPTHLTLRGSLHKYFTGGENISNFSFQDVLTALDRLEAELGISLATGNIYELEFGKTFVVDHAPHWFTCTWGPVPRFNRSTFGNGETVVYSHSRRSFKGYDKAAEARAHHLPIPAGYRDQHLLRLELKYIRGIRRTLGRPLVVSDLRTEETYQELLEAWRGFYFSIPKERKAFIRPDVNRRTLTRNLASMGLIALGGHEALVADIDRRQDLSGTTRSKLKRTLLDLGQDPDFTLTDDMNEELDALVRATCT